MEYDGYHTYLPHHPGYLKDKSTTKIRPVFDQNKIRSLNKVLETGVRKILSISARDFYPIGFLAPRTLFLKIIYQQLWEKGVDWEECAPQEVQTNWKMMMKGSGAFQHLKIPRWIGFSSNVISAEIHVFGDASEAAYGAESYARLQKKNVIT